LLDDHRRHRRRERAVEPEIGIVQTAVDDRHVLGRNERVRIGRIGTRRPIAEPGRDARDQHAQRDRPPRAPHFARKRRREEVRHPGAAAGARTRIDARVGAAGEPVQISHEPFVVAPCARYGEIAGRGAVTECERVELARGQASQSAAVGAREQRFEFGPPRAAGFDEARFAHSGHLARGLARPRS